MSVGAPRRAWITPQGETHKVTIDDHDHYDWVANNLDKIDPSLHSEYGDHADTMTAMLHAGWIRKANSDSYTVGEGHEHRVRAYHLRTHPEEREIYIDVRHRNKKQSSFKYNLDTRTKVKLGESADSLIQLMFLFEDFNVKIKDPHKIYLKHDYTEPDRYATPGNPGFPEHGYNITHPEHGHLGLIVGDEEPNGRFNIRRVVLSGKYGGFADAKGALGVKGVMQVGRELRRFGHTHVYSNSRVSGVRSERGNSNVPDIKLPESIDENTIAKGECFSWAFKRMLDHHVKGEEDAVLVHASVKHPWTGKRYEHAWVEHKGKVYDWQSTAMGLGKQHTVASFKAGYEPKQIKRYNGKQAVRASARAKHYGPW